MTNATNNQTGTPRELTGRWIRYYPGYYEYTTSDGRTKAIVQRGSLWAWNVYRDGGRIAGNCEATCAEAKARAEHFAAA